MYQELTPDYFSELLDQGFCHLPICRELVADFETPLSCYVKVAQGPYSYLLESANQGGEKWSRFSIIGLPARRVLRIAGERLTMTEAGIVTRDERVLDPLAEISELQKQFSYP
ncbi:MAG: anthranilate synthase component I, partial [Pseudomonadales bacterium]